MNLTRDRLQSIGWAAVLLTCFTLLVALTFRVNAVKGQVQLAERQIVALKQDKILLETEFETRASQQQLRALNDVEFGYQAPAVGQYLEGERQLAALGQPRAPGAPSPIRVASADGLNRQSSLPAIVAPLAGKVLGGEAMGGQAAMAADYSRSGGPKPAAAGNLRDRLSQINRAEARSE